MLFSWEARILNKIHITNAFSQLTHLNIHSIDQIDYKAIFQILPESYVITSHLQQVINWANIVSQSKGKEKGELQEYLKLLNEEIKTLGENDSMIEVMIFSCLAKCKIWPKILKCGKGGYLQELIAFYNNFANKYHEELDFKFDPAILSKKKINVMKKVQSRKKDNPQLIQAIKNNQVQQISNILTLIKQKLSEQQSYESVETRFLSYLHSTQHKGKYLPHLLCEIATVEALQLFWKVGMNFQLEDQTKQTPIFYAVQTANMAVIKWLVEEVKVNINHRQKCDRTPIYQASFEGNIQIIEYLYEKGANPKIQSNIDRTPFSKACYLGYVDVVKFLIKIGIPLVHKDNKGRTALHQAVWGIEGGRQGKKKGTVFIRDSPQVAQVLIENGHPVDIVDNDGFTPFLSAVSSCAYDSMRVLLRYKPNIDHRTNKGQTVCYISASYGCLQITKILIQQYECDYRSPNNYDHSPLSISIIRDNPDIFIYLADLYRDNKVYLNFKMFLDCLSIFLKKYNNLNYLIEWINTNQHQNLNYIHQQLLIDGYEPLLMKQHSKAFPVLNKLVTMLIHNNNILPASFINQYLFLCTQLYNSHEYDQYPQLLTLLREHKYDIKITNISIPQHITQQQLLTLLSFESNLVSEEGIVGTLFTIVRLSMTKIIIQLLSTHQIYGYNKQQLQHILVSSMYEGMSLVNYCIVNGKYDIVSILSLSQSINIHVPSYTLSSETVTNPIITIAQNHNQLFDLQHVVSQLNEQQSHHYHSLKGYQPSNHVVLVNNEEEFNIMRDRIRKSYLIGIDVEHYASKQQQFVCLIQLAIASRAYVVDPFYLPRQMISQLLNQVLHSSQIKLFHSYDNDLRWLHEDYQLTDQPLTNIIDTCRMHMILSKCKFVSSLKDLAQQYLNYPMKKDYQKADWRLRPLLGEMLQYAAIDAHILMYLFIKMVPQLKNVELKHKTKTLKCRGIRNVVSLNK